MTRDISSGVPPPLPSPIFGGLVFCLDFDGPKKFELIRKIKQCGGEVCYMVTKRTTHLVASLENFNKNHNQSFKYKTAQRNGTKIVKLEFVLDSLERNECKELPHHFFVSSETNSQNENLVRRTFFISIIFILILAPDLFELQQQQNPKPNKLLST
eukprot:TRINITY_DN7431_c0_g1_i1.p2 TRINITY_DN7431_c0_g1~~TRINITY_DN7431_c0_g1_i1.p2  ORF type:complete len:156 (-),score=44.32 TRINITY_DN7431_c0_g1_i1:253-720(-)